jgi:hypothetical protein
MKFEQRMFAAATVAVAVVAGTACGAEARLGESYHAFKTKLERSYKFTKESKKDDRTYEMFTMIVDDATKAKAPGFGAGLTLTVVDGKILGQALAIRMGDNMEGGKAVAALHVMDFIYEAIGKPAPKSKDAAETEFQQFQSAIEQVLSGLPQHVQYPGFKARITLSRTADGELLLAATPDFSDAGQTGKSH